MDRRRFLFLFGGSTAGLALTGQGVIALPRQMAMLASGRCSFCLGSSGLRSLAGMVGKPARSLLHSSHAIQDPCSFDAMVLSLDGRSARCFFAPLFTRRSRRCRVPA